MSNNLFRALTATLLAFLLAACESDDSSRGSLTVERDLSLSSFQVTGLSLSPTFDASNPGPYFLNVGADVDTVEIEVGSPADSDGVNMLAFRRVVATTSNTLGIEDEQVITAGAAFSFDLEPGDNLFTVRVQTNDEEQRIDYLLSVQRVSNVARLATVSLEDFTTVTSESITTNPTAFDTEVFEYTVSAPFSRCTLGVSASGSDRFTQVQLNGEDLDRGQLRYIEMDVGENSLVFDVQSEDGSANQAYSFTVTRAEADSDDISDVNTLSALGFSAGELRSSVGSEGFNCLLNSYTVRLDADQSSTSVSAVPSIDGRTVELVNVVSSEDENGDAVVSLENPRTIPVGGSIELTVSDDTADNAYAISLARNSDDEPVAHYTFTLARSETNFVYVSSGAELQQALQNASANQEIIIRGDTDLTAPATAADSGKDGVHFYAAASGTAEQPIILRSENLISLTGESTGTGTVLEVAGDYWEIRNLNLSNAAYGLVLDSASNNVIENMEITDIGLRGNKLLLM